ncbi:MAG: hypothetical protein R6T98_08850 [Desulfatiglandales bacterium]
MIIFPGGFRLDSVLKGTPPRKGEPPARRGQNSPMDTLLKRPTREPRPPARLRPGGDSVPEGRAYAPEGTDKKPIVFRSKGVMQRSPCYLVFYG